MAGSTSVQLMVQRSAAPTVRGRVANYNSRGAVGVGCSAELARGHLPGEANSQHDSKDDGSGRQVERHPTWMNPYRRLERRLLNAISHGLQARENEQAEDRCDNGRDDTPPRESGHYPDNHRNAKPDPTPMMPVTAHAMYVARCMSASRGSGGIGETLER